MGLSLKTKLIQELADTEVASLDLTHASLTIGQKPQEIINLDDWPILLFIKGLGIEKVEFKTRDVEAIERWAERLMGYELVFLADPDNLKVIECQWNEIDPATNRALIECTMASVAPSRDYLKSHSSVPPMLAPLGISEDARAKFVHEAQVQSPQEILSRFISILREFRGGTQKIEASIWACLIGDTLTIALEAKLLDKAVQLAEEHKLHLTPLWNNMERTQKLFAAFDPKASESLAWSKIFESLPSKQLVNYMEILLGSEAGPQILKLMNLRAQQEPEVFAEICFEANALVQKLLLQWLNPYWKPFHYGRILNALESSLSMAADNDLVRAWILALVRASKSNAFDDLAKLFQPKFLKLWGSRTNLASKRMILNALADHPSAECREFLKRIRRFVQGELADQVEKLLNGYREVKS